MIKWILIGSILYFASKFIRFLLTFFKFNKSIKEKKRKQAIHQKISKMDIKDAEFEEKVR